MDKQIHQIRNQIQKLGYSITEDTVGRMLKEMGYSLQANVKVEEGGTHKDRDSQFRGINDIAKEFMNSKDPIISVDAKKKERVGNFKNPGRSWRPKDSPHEVNVYDYPSLSKGTAIPYGVGV